MVRNFHRLILVAFLSPSLVEAQPDAGKEPYFMSFKITKAEKKSPGISQLTLDHGLDVGLKANQTGEVWGVSRADTKKHNVKLGDGELTQVGPNESKANLKTDNPLFTGDLFFLSILIPRRTYRSPFFFLTRFNIELDDPQNKPYFTTEEVLNQDGYSLRRKKLLDMLNDIHGAGKKLEEQGNSAKVETGPHRGELVWDVMKKSDTTEVLQYLDYTIDIHREIMG